MEESENKLRKLQNSESFAISPIDVPKEKSISINYKEIDFSLKASCETNRVLQEAQVSFFKRNRIFCLILIGIAIGCILRFFAFDVMYVSGDSMFPALKEGDLVVLNKLAYGVINPLGREYVFRWGTPAEDDIVIFPMNNRYVIKRCIAAGGETLEFSGGTGYSVRVGNKSIPLTESQYQRLKHAEYVPSDMIFVLGDNPAASTDSRDYGFLSVDNIRGKIVWK